MNKAFLLLFPALLLSVRPLRAQGGCVGSPENPTIVLALLGAAGAGLVTARERFAAKRASARKHK